MKSLKTMLKVARAYARSFGARIWKNVRCGIFLTIGELQELYTSQGFNHLGTAMRRHIDAWMSEDAAVLEGSPYRPDSAVWFECPEDLKVSVMVRSEQCGGRFVTEITRTEWPILRRMHGLEQEVLA